MISNTTQRYGLLHILLHWSMAAIVLFLFASGLYMVTLTYYDSGYNIWPHRHKSLGVVLAILLLIRIVWVITQPKPKPLANHKRWEVITAHAAHGLMYLLMLTMIISGYLIATARDESIKVFNLFSLPPIVDADTYATLLGDIHACAAWTLIAIVAVHALGALKHTIIDRDATLGRMLMRTPHH